MGPSARTLNGESLGGYNSRIAPVMQGLVGDFNLTGASGGQYTFPM